MSRSGNGKDSYCLLNHIKTDPSVLDKYCNNYEEFPIFREVIPTVSPSEFQEKYKKMFFQCNIILLVTEIDELLNFFLIRGLLILK